MVLPVIEASMDPSFPITIVAPTPVLLVSIMAPTTSSIFKSSSLDIKASTPPLVIFLSPRLPLILPRTATLRTSHIIVFVLIPLMNARLPCAIIVLPFC